LGIAFILSSSKYPLTCFIPSFFIYTHLKIVKNFTLFGNLNEFQQVILNIINNAKDAFESRGIEDATINNRPRVIITDNAGGIDKKILIRYLGCTLAPKRVVMVLVSIS